MPGTSVLGAGTCFCITRPKTAAASSPSKKPLAGERSQSTTAAA